MPGVSRVGEHQHECHVLDLCGDRHGRGIERVDFGRLRLRRQLRLLQLMPGAGVPVRLRPMPLGELLDETFKLYRLHFTVIAGVALIVIIPNLIVTLVSGSYRANPFTYVQDLLQNASNPAALQAVQNRQAQYTSSPLYLLSFPVAILMKPFTNGPHIPTADPLAGRQLVVNGSSLDRK